ncbi:MAG: serine acetyltransferase [Lachnospiraceae bacterium]|nr:serine acetyltransferase [Lachnospiraceae bacterium]
MRIETKAELKRVLEIEEKVYGKKWYYCLPAYLTEQQILYRHALLLRKAEYTTNNRKLSRYWYLIRLLRIQTRYGISIPLNVLDEGFEIVHLGSVIINANAKVGKYARLHPGVCIGANHDKAPHIGDYVYIGPGAKIFGDITLASHIQVGANAVVTKSCDMENVILAGVPAKVVGGGE